MSKFIGMEQRYEPQILASLATIRLLRSSVRQVFETLGNGIRSEHGDDGRENRFLLELQEQLNTIATNLRY